MICKISRYWTVMVVVVVLSVLATAQATRFHVIVLGGLGGTQTTAFGINNRGWVTGGGSLADDFSEHALLWRPGNNMTDLGTLGGPNSGAGFPLKNDRGFIPGFSQIETTDPLGEDWTYNCLDLLSGVTPCQDNTRESRGFVWQDRAMTSLPTLGGHNAQAWGGNNRGQIVGVAETGTQDPSCIPPQIFDYEAVIWNPSEGRISKLPPYPGDSVSAAIGINEGGQVVGASGGCAPISPAIAAHAMLWEHGKPISIGSLGGSFGNVAYAINNRGQVAGVSDLAGDNTAHAFIWQIDRGMLDLGTLPGDFLSIAYSINDSGQVVGTSCDVNFTCRAFVWQKGIMTDLNTLIPPNSSLYLLSANDLNDRGEIVGQAFDQSNTTLPAFLTVPCDGEPANDDDCQASARSDIENLKSVLPASIREQLRHMPVLER